MTDRTTGLPANGGREASHVLRGRSPLQDARGTSEEVVDASGLITFRGEGPGADRMAGELAHLPGVLTAAPFGQAVHVSGTERKPLEASIAPFRERGIRWTETDPTLEDVFIRLMSAAPDNFSEGKAA